MKLIGMWAISVICAVIGLGLSLVSLPFFMTRPKLALWILIGWDQLGNTYAAGYPDEMISARAHRSGWVWRERIIDWIFHALTGEVDHCRRAYEKEQVRAYFPTAYRNPEVKP